MPRIVLVTADGELVLDAPSGGKFDDICDAAACAAPMAFSCRDANCATCRVVVLDGAGLLDAVGEDEQRALDRIGTPHGQRLACTLRVSAGDGTLRLRRVRDDE